MRLSTLILLLSSLVLSTASGRRRKATSTTTEASVVNLEETLADREASLLEREEQFRKREVVFREREEKLSLREEQFKSREDKLSKREKNIELREQNTVRGSSASSCPSSDEADYSSMRLDVDTGKLAEIGEVGTCPENMRFFASPDNETLGSCDCDYHTCSGRPLLYSDKYKQCFWAWSQGPCEQAEWYVFDENYSPTCQPNPCPDSLALGTNAYYFKSWEDDKCYKAGSRGPCPKPERLYTTPDDPIPKCRRSSSCPSQSVPAQARCLPGNRRYFQGLCNESVSSSSSSVGE